MHPATIHLSKTKDLTESKGWSAVGVNRLNLWWTLFSDGVRGPGSFFWGANRRRLLLAFTSNNEMKGGPGSPSLRRPSLQKGIRKLLRKCLRMPTLLFQFFLLSWNVLISSKFLKFASNCRKRWNLFSADKIRIETPRFCLPRCLLLVFYCLVYLLPLCIEAVADLLCVSPV